MSNDYTDAPWGGDNAGTSNNPGDSFAGIPPGNNPVASQPTEQPITRGNRGAVADLPLAIRNRLNPHWSAWTLLSPDEARYLVANERTRFFTQNRRGRWEETRGRIVGSMAPWVCLERVASDPNRRARSGGGGANPVSSEALGASTTTAPAA